MKDTDLSEQIVRVIPRGPGEQVTCTRVAPDHYRCNWWTLQNTAAYDNPSMLGALVTTSRISRSQYLHVVENNAQLAITVINPAPPAEHSR